MGSSPILFPCVEVFDARMTINSTTERFITIVALVIIAVFSWKISATLFLVLLFNAILIQSNVLENRLMKGIIRDFQAMRTALPEKSEDDICRMLIAGRLKSTTYKNYSIEDIRRDLVDPTLPSVMNLSMTLRCIIERENQNKYGDSVVPGPHDRVELQAQRRAKLGERVEKFVRSG